MRRPLALTGVLLLAAIGPGPAQQGKADPSVNLDQIKLGKVLHGPAVSDADLKGQVVLVEFWGIN
jgi:hypothetical protein